MQTLKTDSNIRTIWNSTHKDYRGMLGGKHSILTQDGLTTLEGMPDDQFAQHLKDAQDRVERDIIKGVARQLFKKYGVNQVNEGAINQWCGSFEGIRDLLRFATDITNDQRNTMLANVDRYEAAYQQGIEIDEPSISLTSSPP